MSKIKYGPRSFFEAKHTGDAKSATCPNCGGTNIHRSRARSQWEKRLRRYFPVRYWRCHDCDHRTLRFEPKHLHKLALNILFWVLVAATFVVYRKFR